jgi:hypothetical protein
MANNISLYITISTGAHSTAFWGGNTFLRLYCHMQFSRNKTFPAIIIFPAIWAALCIF